MSTNKELPVVTATARQIYLGLCRQVNKAGFFEGTIAALTNSMNRFGRTGFYASSVGGVIHRLALIGVIEQLNVRRGVGTSFYLKTGLQFEVGANALLTAGSVQDRQLIERVVDAEIWAMKNPVVSYGIPHKPSFKARMTHANIKHHPIYYQARRDAVLMGLLCPHNRSTVGGYGAFY